MMRRFCFIYIILVPYLILGAMALVYKICGGNVGGGELIAMVLLIVMLCGVGAAACVGYNLLTLKVQTDIMPAVQNLVIKAAYFPMHLLMLALTMGMMNPFLLWAAWLPAVLGYCLVAYSGFANIASCINLVRHKRCTLTKAIVLGVLSFIYIGDIVGAVIQIISARSFAPTTGSEEGQSLS